MTRTTIERELCRMCGGNGVIKIPGGVSQCWRCGGDCYERETTLRTVLDSALKSASAIEELSRAAMHHRAPVLTPEQAYLLLSLLAPRQAVGAVDPQVGDSNA